MTERAETDVVKGRVKLAHLLGRELPEFCHRVGVHVFNVSVGATPAAYDVLYADLQLPPNDSEIKTGQGSLGL